MNLKKSQSTSHICAGSALSDALHSLWTGWHQSVAKMNEFLQVFFIVYFCFNCKVSTSALINKMYDYYYESQILCKIDIQIIDMRTPKRTDERNVTGNWRVEVSLPWDDVKYWRNIMSQFTSATIFKRLSVLWIQPCPFTVSSIVFLNSPCQ